MATIIGGIPIVVILPVAVVGAARGRPFAVARLAAVSVPDVARVRDAAALIGESGRFQLGVFTRTAWREI